MEEIEYWKSTQLESYPNEEWRDIPNYEGLYQVSNLGRVKSLEKQTWNHQCYVTRKPRILKQFFDSKKYPQVRLCNNDNQPTFKVHKLVAMTWLNNPHNKPQIDHINTIKTDNRVENLHFVTGIENNNNPLTKQHRLEGLKKHNKSIPIVQVTLDGHYIKTWKSAVEVEKETGIKRSSISSVLRGKYHHAGGYKWVYLSEYNEGV